MPSPSRLEPTFLTPTTCLTLACVAFSLVAITTVWRNSNSASAEAKKEERLEEPVQSKPQPTARIAADSLYPETREEYTRKPYHRPAISRGPRSHISEILLLSARVSQQLQSCQEDAPQLQLVAVNLLSELSLLTSSLCRLQQELFTKPASLSNGVGLSTCFGAVTSSLQAILISLETSLNSASPSSSALGTALQQLKDQRPVVDFLLSKLYSSEVPPTPPSETFVEASLKRNNSSLSQLEPSPTMEPHTGITPGVDEKCWIEPPPEYSPPSSSASADFVPEKVDEKTESPPQKDKPENAKALYDAVTDNDDARLFHLLANDADPKAHFGELQRTALHQAAHLNHVVCLSILLKHGAIMATEDAKGDTALHLAAWAGNVEALSALLAHGADVDWLSGRDGYSPLWCAISAHQIDAARLLLKSGARLSLRAASGSGLTPLHQAAVTGQAAMCELLLERGAQPNCLDDDKNTPLHYAAASGSVPSVTVLLRSGADIEARQVHGLTAVHWAAHKANTEVLSLLLDYGAGLDRRAEEGATPLHLAANRGHTAAARLLVERGANRNLSMADWDGVSGTPADMAESKGHKGLAKMLRS